MNAVNVHSKYWMCVPFHYLFTYLVLRIQQPTINFTGLSEIKIISTLSL